MANTGTVAVACTLVPNHSFFHRNWNCRTCEPLIEFLEHWLPLVPPWILDNIRDQLVLPRIQHEVEEWNPMTDTVPIHAWIHPWLPLLGTVEFLFDEFLEKFLFLYNTEVFY